MARSGAGGGGSRGGGGGSRGGGGFKSGGGSRSGGSLGGAGRSGAGRSGASGGAGRGFGSSFGNSGPSRSGASGGARPGGFGGGPIPPRGGGYRPPPPPPRYGFFRRRPRPYYGGGWRSWTPWGGYGYRRGCGCGGSVMALLIVLLLVLGSLGSCSALSFLPWYGYGSGYGYYGSYGYDDYYYYQGTGYDSTSGIPKSTLNRTPLPASSVVETEYYTDEMDWIHNNQTLTSGMREFYAKTGVQPYLYIAAEVGGTSEPGEAQIRDFTVDRYDELFVDEAHLLLVFVDGDYDYTAQLVCGSDAVSVIDGQAMDILLAYLDQYYYDGSLGDEEYFSLVFSKTANDIMKTQMSPWLVVTIVGAVVFLVGLLVAVLVSRSKKSQGNP